MRLRWQPLLARSSSRCQCLSMSHAAAEDLPYSRGLEIRNTFGSVGARAFLNFFSVPPLFAKKPLRRSFFLFKFPADFFRRGAPSKELEPHAGFHVAKMYYTVPKTLGVPFPRSPRSHSKRKPAERGCGGARAFLGKNQLNLKKRASFLI